MNKKVLIGVGVVVLVVLGWLLVRNVLSSQAEIPYTPDSAEYKERMQKVEESSAEQAANATPGVGVFSPGTLPQPEPVEAGTTSEAVVDESGE